MEDQQLHLTYDYVYNHIFEKLSDTFDKYRNILPDIEEVEQAIVDTEITDAFDATVLVIDMLKSHGERSALVQEIYINVGQDFRHGMNPALAEYEGKYYLRSVSDESF